MKKLNILFIPEILRWKISIRWSTAAILLLAVPCMPARIAANLNLFLSAATAVSVLLVETNIPWSALPVCPSNLSMFHTDIASSLSMKICVVFFLKTALFLTASSIPSILLSLVCFSKRINQKTSLPVSSWSYTPSDAISSGILIFTALSQKVGLVMTVYGDM